MSGLTAYCIEYLNLPLTRVLHLKLGAASRGLLCVSVASRSQRETPEKSAARFAS